LTGEVLLSVTAFAEAFRTQFDPEKEYVYTYEHGVRSDDTKLLTAGEFRVAGVFMNFNGMDASVSYGTVFTDIESEFSRVAHESPLLYQYHTKLTGNRADNVALANFLVGNMYSHTNESYLELFRIYNGLATFGGIMTYLAVALSLAAVLMVMDFMFSTVKDRTGETGTLRALGVRNADVFKIFGFQALFFLVASAIACVCLSLVLATAMNGILHNMYVLLYSVYYLDNMLMLTLSPGPFFLMLGILSSVVALSVLVPIAYMAKAKPIKLISKG